MEFPSDLHPDSVNEFSSPRLLQRERHTLTKAAPYSIGNRIKDDERETDKKSKDVHNGSHSPDSILSQVQPESRPQWEQWPNMGSVG